MPRTLAGSKGRAPVKRTTAERLQSLLEEHPERLDEAPSRTALPLVHPFPAPMSPDLVKTLIAETTDQAGIILDPMAGSGTVPAAARALGRECRAMDIDPLARMTMRVLCADYDLSELERIGKTVAIRASKLARKRRAMNTFLRRSFDDDTRDFIEFWFPLRARQGLLALREAIQRQEPGTIQDALFVAFSRVIIAKTAGASLAIDLPHTRPHRKLDKIVPDPLGMFPRRLNELIQRLEKRTIHEEPRRVSVRSGDVRRLPYKGEMFDLIITSSPYANAIDYMRAHKFSLVWMGYPLGELTTIRSKMIGAERGETDVWDDREWVEAYLPRYDGRADRRTAMLRRYFYDMDSVLSEMRRVLRPGGACVFVLGKSIIGGQEVDTPSVVARLAEDRGFVHIGTRYRQVNPLRRSLPFPVAGGREGALANRMQTEAIVALAG